MTDDSGARVTSEKGGRPPLIESFGIRGLFGYKDLSLSTDHAAAILIARNGSGKTTLLGAMDAFLKCQFTRLRGLEFSEIFCSLRTTTEPLILSHSDLTEFLELPSDPELEKLARQASVEPARLYSFLIEEWPLLRPERSRYTDHPVFSSIWHLPTSRSISDVSASFDRLRTNVLTRRPRIASIYEALQRELEGIDIVYLPTYRRIELALPEEIDKRTGTRARPKFKLASGSLHVGDIQFGLSDIAERLSELNQRILVQSNQGYREISANIINDLIDGSFRAKTKRHKPDREELELFFSRLQDPRHLTIYPPVSAPNLDKIYKEEHNEGPDAPFLNYFLSELSTVITSTHEVEAQVEEFIFRCNRYLSFRDYSTELDTAEPADPRSDIDAKMLQLDKKNLHVNVLSLATKQKVSLDSLSSGEKQMVSLFAKLFLYPREKIVLIDEPELSLSLDWQKRILVDILDAPLCKQVIAITHSPFVFDNSLEAFAAPLRVELDTVFTKAPHADDDDASNE